jgi:hypothetical protein
VTAPVHLVQPPAASRSASALDPAHQSRACLIIPPMWSLVVTTSTVSSPSNQGAGRGTRRQLPMAATCARSL